jgi:hypothetical protein
VIHYYIIMTRHAKKKKKNEQIMGKKSLCTCGSLCGHGPLFTSLTPSDFSELTRRALGEDLESDWPTVPESTHEIIWTPLSGHIHNTGFKLLFKCCLLTEELLC